MRVLVTGANGHIGNHVVREVIAAGLSPVAFHRPGADQRALAGLSCEHREGDLLDAASVARATQGVDAVIHVGAVHANAEKSPGEMARTAVEGTRAVLDAAAKAKVKRVVLCSSGATVGFAKDPARPLDESHHQEKTSNPYIGSKVEQERFALAEAARLGLELVVVNPSGVFGPRDYRLTPATRALVGLLQGDPAFLHLCITDVRDVGRAHVLAMQKGAPGQRYLVSGDQLAPKQVSELTFKTSGIKPPVFRPPDFLLRFIIGRAEKKARASGIDPPASLSGMDDLDGGQLAYDSGRSRRELGMTYRPAEDVLRDSWRWLLHQNALKPKVAARVRAALGPAAAPDADWIS
jgi:dihydroflavonol-4-reductase